MVGIRRIYCRETSVCRRIHDIRNDRMPVGVREGQVRGEDVADHGDELELDVIARRGGRPVALHIDAGHLLRRGGAVRHIRLEQLHSGCRRLHGPAPR